MDSVPENADIVLCQAVGVFRIAMLRRNYVIDRNVKGCSHAVNFHKQVILIAINIIRDKFSYLDTGQIQLRAGIFDCGRRYGQLGAIACGIPCIKGISDICCYWRGSASVIIQVHPVYGQNNTAVRVIGSFNFIYPVHARLFSDPDFPGIRYFKLEIPF